PEATVMVPNTYTVLSGGFWVDWHGAGNLATASVPVLKPDGTISGWTAKSKDHLKGSPATIWAYAGGIKSMLPGGGGGAQQVFKSEPARAPHPAAEVTLVSGLLTGAGAEVHYNPKVGNMLTRIQPFFDDSSIEDPVVQGVGAGAKDHKDPRPAQRHCSRRSS